MAAPGVRRRRRGEEDGENDLRRSRRLGRRKYAPEHFAFVTAATELKQLNLWVHRRTILCLAIAFIVKGGHALFCLERSQWTFPIVNDGLLLRVHWALASPFLGGVLVQRIFTLPHFANVGQQHTAHVARTKRRVHRIVGRVTMVCSLGAAVTAMALAKRALADSCHVFWAWSLLWIGTTVLAWRAALQRRWGAHQMWAQAMTRNGLSFVYGRFFLALYVECVYRYQTFDDPTNHHNSSSSSSSRQERAIIINDKHVKDAYYWAVVATGGVALLQTIQAARIHARAERRATTQRHWRKLRYAFFVLLLSGYCKRKRNSKDKKHQ